MFIPSRKSFNGPRRFAFSGALTCIMRYRASLLAECFLPACLPACQPSCPGLGGSRRCYGSSLPEFQRSKFYGRYVLTASCFVYTYVRSHARARTRPSMYINAAVAVHMHYPIIVAMTKVSRANRGRETEPRDAPVCIREYQAAV